MLRLLVLLFIAMGVPVGAQDLRSVLRSEVVFLSDAPLERITAKSTTCTAIIDLQQRTFAAQVPVRSFEGFNSPLQKEHFNENYLESGTYPLMTFQGRIIESTDLSKPGEHRVRAKGEFTVHGVTKERIIECTCVVTTDGIRLTSAFNVLIEDHAIRVPRVVQQKVAATVEVKVDLLFGPKKKAQ
jgi:hypothetical protein